MEGCLVGIDRGRAPRTGLSSSDWWEHSQALTSEVLVEGEDLTPFSLGDQEAGAIDEADSLPLLQELPSPAMQPLIDPDDPQEPFNRGDELAEDREPEPGLDESEALDQDIRGGEQLRILAE
jgi:hypothetical protein